MLGLTYIMNLHHGDAIIRESIVDTIPSACATLYPLSDRIGYITSTYQANLHIPKP